jgi:hypothetical protein
VLETDALDDREHTSQELSDFFRSRNRQSERSLESGGGCERHGIDVLVPKSVDRQRPDVRTMLDQARGRVESALAVRPIGWRKIDRSLDREDIPIAGSIGRRQTRRGRRD